MKVSLNWLRELVELPPTVPALVDLLTMAGVEVEGIETTGCSIANIVVGEIQESAQHPNADRLSVCKVDDGSGTQRQIVCGAKNYKVGDKVPLALPGAQLAPDFAIKVGKLRGVESQGMLCSAEELGLPATLGARGAKDGLLILPAEAKPGTPFSEVFHSDTVLDLEITPNRPDLLSHAGIAVEIATLTGRKITKPDGPAEPKFGGDLPAVAVETVSPCCYTARRISGVKVGPSPEWLRAKLESIGLRAINNVVDVTNFVMMASGQPLHAFDAAKVRGALRVRNASEGEQFLALDGKTYALRPGDLVIADDEKALAIAGVMGGESSGVSETTTEVLLEAAVFEPASIRRTSRRLGLSSDSSYRFERGVWSGGIERASLCAAKYIAEVAGASLVSPAGEAGQPEILAQRNAPRAAIPLRLARLAALLGVDVPQERVDQILTGFGCEKTADGWRPPGFRLDLIREVDLIEEIARVIGMEVIPARTQARFTGASATDRNYDRVMALRQAFVAQGFHEARSITLVPAEPLGLKFAKTDPASLLRVKNPMNDDQIVLRPGLLHGLLTAVRDNLRAGAKSVRLFEIGRVFSTQRPEEFTRAAAVLAGPLAERNWRAGEGRSADIFDLKAVMCAVFGEGVALEPEENSALALSLAVKANGKPVGFAGQLWPADARALDADVPIVFVEVDLAALWKNTATDAAKKYREIPRFPATSRDIAMLAPLSLSHEAISSVLAKAKEPLLAAVELFDVFTDATGAKVPADKKSLAYSLTYRSAERTLTADEVNAAHSRLKQRLTSELAVVLRE
jgi:phenylalanyl-tRNA synthetase beta chain